MGRLNSFLMKAKPKPAWPTINGPWNCWHRRGCSSSTICAASHLARWIIHAILPLEPFGSSASSLLTIRVSSPPLRLSVTASWSLPWRLTTRRSDLFGILEVALHDLLEMLSRDSAVLGCPGDVPAVRGQFAFDIPHREGFQHLLLGVRIG